MSEYVDMWEESSSHFKPQPEDIHIKMMLRQNGSRSSLKFHEHVQKEQEVDLQNPMTAASVGM